MIFLAGNEDKIAALTNWIDEQGQWAEDYMSHVDNINNYAEMFETHSLFYGEIDEEIRDEVKALLESMDDSEILEYCDEPFIHYGYNCQYREIWSINFGEIETQLTGIYDHVTKTNCVYTDLCQGLSKAEIKLAGERSDQCVYDGSIYQDHSYDRVSITLDVDRLLKEKTSK